MKIKGLKSLLLKYDIPIENYGIGRFKTLKQLLEEVNSKEVILKEVDGILKRFVRVVTLNVFSHDSSKFLVEEKQIFANGVNRCRCLDTSTGEKQKYKEFPKTAVLRLINEEFPALNFGGSLKTLKKLKKRKETRESQSYPGLTTDCIFTDFSIRLMVWNFPMERFVTTEEDKIVLWNWESIS